MFKFYDLLVVKPLRCTLDHRWPAEAHDARSYHFFNFSFHLHADVQQNMTYMADIYCYIMTEFEETKLDPHPAAYMEVLC